MTTEEMSVLEAIHSLRAVRRYKPDPVEPEKLTRVLRAGTMAPSSGNVQPWEFVAVTAPELKAKIKELILPAFQIMDSQGRAQTPEQLKDSSGRPVSGHWAVEQMDSVPVLIMVCYNPVRGRRFKDQWRWFEELRISGAGLRSTPAGAAASFPPSRTCSWRRRPWAWGHSSPPSASCGRLRSSSSSTSRTTSAWRP